MANCARQLAQYNGDDNVKMKLKKETKHTCVYEASVETDIVPVRSVYVDKVWLLAKRTNGSWPKEITLEITLS